MKHTDAQCSLKWKASTRISRKQFLQNAGVAWAGVSIVTATVFASNKKDWLLKPLETDPESGAEIFQLTEDARPTDDIYGEQPYSSPDGSRIAVEHASSDKSSGGVSIFSLTDGSFFPVVVSKPRFPSFHAWGEYLYYQQTIDDKLILKRCHYRKHTKEDVAELPKTEGTFSYGTVSPDHRYYAVSVHPESGGSKVLVVDLKTGERRTIAQQAEYYFKHEQFSRDGRNRVLIQANKMPDVKQVRLGALEVNREGIQWFPADRPHTPRPTGHEAWVGSMDKILFSTASDKDSQGNIWMARSIDSAPALVSKTPVRFGHVSVSRCGRFWLGDAISTADVPIHIGSLKTDKHRRLVFSRTKHDGKQSSHTHPYLTADNRWLIFNSTRSGLAQVYGARLKEGFLDSL